MIYQGRLADSSGDLLGGSGTTYYFKFSLWDDATVGNGNRVGPISAPSSFSTTVRQGVFTVNIGDTANGYPDALTYTFTSPNVYLQVEVSSNGTTFETLSPRQRISSAAYAQVSGGVTGTIQSSIGTTSTASNTVPYSVQYQNITAVLAKAVQELNLQVAPITSSPQATPTEAPINP